MIITGISVDFRPDLMDRALPLTFERRARPWSETKARALWQDEKAQVLGKLVELLIAGCGLGGSIDIGNHHVQHPRFVDAATLAEACARGAGWPDWLLVDALAEVEKAGQTSVADGSPLVGKLARILQKKGGTWTAQAGEWRRGKRHFGTPVGRLQWWTENGWPILQAAD